MNIVFMGTPDFASVSLEALLKAGFPIRAVFSQPDRPVGRHQEILPTPVKAVALAHDIPVYQPTKIREPENLEILKSLKPDLIVVVAFGQILPQAILNLPPYGCVNVHGSLLPEYRGAAPIQRALLEGKDTTGITTMLLDAGMDTGDILLTRTLPIESTDTSETLFDKLAILGAETLLETIKGLEAGTITPKKQDASLATYAPMLTKEEGCLDFTQSAHLVDCRIRAMTPWPSAYTFCNGKRIKVLKAHPVAGNGTPGQTLDEKNLIIACGKDAICLDLVQPDGKKPQSAQDFANGLQSRSPVFGQQ